MVATAASASPARMRNGLVRRIGGRGAVVAATLVLSLARAMPGHAGAQPAPAAANHAPAQSPAAAEQAPAAPPASAPPAGPVSHPPEAAKQAAVAPPASAPSPIAKTPFAEVFAQLAARLEAVVVNISTTQAGTTAAKTADGKPANPGSQQLDELFRDFFGDRAGPGEQNGLAPPIASLGSGFIIDPSGLIVTNNHVVANAAEIAVTLADNTTYEAQVIGRDPVSDLALLKIDAKRPLPAAKWGDSGKARVGDWVLAIGNPFGLGGTVTSGIISATARDIHAGPYDDFLQTDASINRGNSGGPMFNLDGEVIGINTAIYSPSGGSIGIGFAIPSASARPIIDQLRTTGKVV